MHIFVLLFGLLSAFADDRCIASYDNKNPVVGMLEKATGQSLSSSQWVVCGGRAFVDPTKCESKVETRFKFDAEKTKFVLTVTELADEKVTAIAKGMGNPTLYAPLIKRALASGLPFNAFLCARDDKTTYVRLVGTGMAAKQGGTIEISQDAQGVRMSELNTDTGASK